MAENSNIEWTDHTFNPWIGCQKVSPGCDHCYAETWDDRGLQHSESRWGPHAARTRTSPSYWRKPLAWDRAAKAAGKRARVFCASLADVFDNHGSITSGWRGDLWHLIARTPNLDWLLLTKRPQHIAKMLPEGYGAPAWGGGWPNVWIGTTVENQTEADRRIPHLLSIPARVRFLSVEPMLGPVDLGEPVRTALRSGRIASSGYGDGTKPLSWVICGGESGPGARPMHPDWARSLRDQCVAAGVPFFFKQWGEWGRDTGILPDLRDPVMEGRAKCAVVQIDGSTTHYPNGYAPPLDGPKTEAWLYRLGKKTAGRLLDDRTWDELPEVDHG